MSIPGIEDGVEYLTNGETRGVDPRALTREGLWALGHEKMPLAKVIRAKCLDCSHVASEVRYCTATGCELWPYRMGTNPFTERKGNPEALRAKREDG